ncbi:uncharacterized protein SPPG_06694 [Spizellomyces punctatus DAOM BR117]|uniref:Kinesin-like protein n=1 Tax=Spizellomyces punctatus (strain DAOM BR117) TaxID=645134 RepID=A0A0L0HBP7_SPIPD|nr:hypothetical protein, variant 2 [Spizellomyces punctatus DAOM BR117]XP_016606339.1 hypothetical protein, variant 1 [Spizellomyces punctatus DAOM BR117]XP_016606340.1 uncharacterized protein SPPG_06694 [Spizellomyces punctatus DAOM BR117]KNC98298.1 hypothetical protein, variant 2 [Spizellomyces punctatus DAOM BR117]KNC98299.1 hypothetical protein, variant 1 [Spizellomyces punctatus DAOM BR117]KNC98300.1 hypothetical protein SPPG_06694 [Spizellomyces punctatus DAOM BR117]|eukprot:XP_016606338.1 hypothetical protein, variant 2 [Spizellomyces punctatus DAOM BR117]
MDPAHFNHPPSGSPVASSPRDGHYTHATSSPYVNYRGNLTDTARSTSSSHYSAFSSHSAKSATKDENIHVVVRFRPPSSASKRPGSNEIVICGEDRQTLQMITANGERRQLTFDQIFDANCLQADVFENSGVKDLVIRALDGYATTVFAFGQTGSGKSFTMTGPPGAEMDLDRSGIILRALQFLFAQISARPDITYTVRAAYLEIYNEHVHDLLSPSTASSLTVRYSASRGFYVENLLVLECHALGDCVAVLQEGLRNRTTRAHQLNEYSSRSHAMMTLYIDSERADPEGGLPLRQHGKISFVDLAGSEKVKESKTTGDMLTETFNINKSLLTLGNCISALSDPRKRNGHIPYRDSNLTRLLADSLGGSGLALMIACISSSPHHSNETLKTLRYAQRAKRIQNRPAMHIEPRDEVVNSLKREIDQLRRENQHLKAMLSQGEIARPHEGEFGVQSGVHLPQIAQVVSYTNHAAPERSSVKHPVSGQTNQTGRGLHASIPASKVRGGKGSKVARSESKLQRSPAERKPMNASPSRYSMHPPQAASRTMPSGGAMLSPNNQPSMVPEMWYPQWHEQPMSPMMPYPPVYQYPINSPSDAAQIRQRISQDVHALNNQIALMEGRRR